jgi:hypothetical protein
MPARGSFHGAVLWLGLALAPAGAALAQPDAAEAPPPAKVRELLSLMDDAEVREWLGERQQAAAAAEAPRARPR